MCGMRFLDVVRAVAPLVGLASVVALVLDTRRRRRAASPVPAWPELPPDAVAIVMPSLGEGVAAATVVRMRKQVGDPVQVGDPAADVSTDKVDTEIPATTAGTVVRLFVTEGDEVPVGHPLLAVRPPALAGPIGDPSAPAADPEPLARTGAETFAGDPVIDDHHNDAE